MGFAEFKRLLQDHVLIMCKSNSVFFVTDTDKDKLWDTYLDSFPAGTNEIFRERREYDCSCCRQFFRLFGNVVSIEKNKVVSIWDFKIQDKTYQVVIDALSAFVKSESVCGVFVTKESGFGTDQNYEQCEDGTVRTWEHFRVSLPNQFVIQSAKTVASLESGYRDVKNVFKRSLEEISQDAVDIVLDLIAQKSLYKGEEWGGVLSKFILLHRAYHKLHDNKKDVYCWRNSVEVGGVVGKIRNHSIGVLLTDISNGVDVNEAVRKYEAIVAPTNYKRPKAVFTKKMIEQAEKTITELGFLDSLKRRFAEIDDITVNNILFANRDTLKQMTSGVFSELQADVPRSLKNFDHVEVVPVEQFVRDVLPRVTHMEVLFENKHVQNLVSIITSQVSNAPTMFKWDNGISWAYNGNIADSMKQQVKAAGGNVDGVLRFSIRWNENADNRDDLDAHCFEPNGNHISFPVKGKRQVSTGMLDVDIIHPAPAQVAVENITWTDRAKMPEGIYIFSVHNYTSRGGRSGFSAEIEYSGQIYAFEYGRELRLNETVIVAKVKFTRKHGIQFVESLKSEVSAHEEWGIQTNLFHPVSVCMYSPNYWDAQMGSGHRHYFFMLKGCLNTTQPNGFFNEFLREDLLQHKRVFEALGAKMRVEHSDNQLSGVGFSSTQRNTLVCRLEGHINRTLKITF